MGCSWIALGGGKDSVWEPMEAKKMSAKALKQAYPDEPWHWRPEWHAGLIKSSGKTEAVLLGVMGLVFFGLSLPALMALPRELARGNYPILAVLLFTLIGLWLMFMASKAFGEVLRYGALTFKPDTLPGSWGGMVGGVITIPKGAQAVGPINLEVACIHKKVSGSGKNRRVSEVPIWETKEIRPAVSLQGMGPVTEIPVNFHVPRDSGNPTDLSEERNQTIWRLKLEMPVRRQPKPLTATFDIPVFDLGEDVETTAPPPSPEELASQLEAAMLKAGVEVSQGADGVIWEFFQPKAKGGAFVLGFMAAIFGTVGWFLPMLFMKVVFMGFAFLMAAILPGLIWRRSELRLNPREVVVRKRGWRGWHEWRFAANEIADLRLDESMRSGNDRYLRLTAIGVRGVDPEIPHTAEHFKARKARYRWKREIKRAGAASDETTGTLLETPCFELEVAGYLRGTMAAERVRENLLATLKRMRT